tara:strand:+ start:2301 stop:2978 length:678 start_codon:yes stop_codon:yes gene_type:complete
MKNLYSILSNKGRMGDTELRYVNGELSHVNKQEAYILDNYGQAGENFVIENGSGTINPETGMKEYILPVITAIGAGIGAIASGAQYFQTQAANKRTSREIDNQIADLRKQKNEVDANTIDLLENLSQRTDLKEQDLFTDFISKSEDIASSGDVAISKANLATSGGILDNLNRRRDDLLTEFGEDTSALQFEEEDKVLSIATDAENSKTQLENQILSLTAQKARYG